MAGIWARRLKSASFRGVPFFIDSHEFKTGRNTVAHEAPDQNKTFAEDIGLKTREFSIQGHILGDDYFRLRDNLIDACEETGSGELSHPYLGVKTVQCVDFNFAEDTQEGRVARFNIKFIDAGESNFPSNLFDVVAEYFDAANNAIDSVKSAFDAVYSLANLPGFVTDEMTVLVGNMLDLVENSLDTVSVVDSKKAEMKEKIATLRADITTLAASANLISTEGINLIKDLKEVVAESTEDDSAAIDTNSGKDDTLTIFDTLLTFNDDAPDLDDSTDTRSAQKVAADAFEALVKQATIITLADQSVVKEFKTINAADSQRESLVDLIEGQLDSITDDDLFQNFQDLKANIIKAIPNENAITANEVEVETKAVMPVLALVYDLNENLDNEKDFIDRNKVRHPGFITPGSYTGLNG